MKTAIKKFAIGIAALAVALALDWHVKRMWRAQAEHTKSTIEWFQRKVGK